MNIVTNWYLRRLSLSHKYNPVPPTFFWLYTFAYLMFRCIYSTVCRTRNIEMRTSRFGRLMLLYCSPKTFKKNNINTLKEEMFEEDIFMEEIFVKLNYVNLAA